MTRSSTGFGGNTGVIGAGKRNKLITIQSLTQTTTDEGEVTETAATVAKVWAAIEPLSAREQRFALQSQATTTHRITIMYRDDVTSRMQETWESRTFKFESVVDSHENKREQIIMATEVTA